MATSSPLPSSAAALLLALALVASGVEGALGGRRLSASASDDDMPTQAKASATMPAVTAAAGMPKLLASSVFKATAATGVLAEGTVYLGRTMGCWSNVGRTAYRPSCRAFSVVGHGSFPRFNGPADSKCFSCCDTAVHARGDARCWNPSAAGKRLQPQWLAVSFDNCCATTADRGKKKGSPQVAHAFSGSAVAKNRYYERVDIAKHFYMLYWRPKGGFKSSSEEQAACVLDKAAHLLMFATCTPEELLRPKKSTYRLDCDRAFIGDLLQDLRSCCVGVEHAAMWKSQQRCEHTIAPLLKIAGSYAKPFAKCVKVVDSERRTDPGEDASFRSLMLKIKGPSGATSIFRSTNANCEEVRDFASNTYAHAYSAAQKMYRYARHDAAKLSQFPGLAAKQELPQVGTFLKLCKPHDVAAKQGESVAGVSTKCHIKLGMAYSASVKIAAKLHMTATKCRKNPTLGPGCEDFWDEGEWRKNWKVFCKWCTCAAPAA